MDEALRAYLDRFSDTPTILIQTDRSCEMAKISIDGVPNHEGNYWDFHPGCFGGIDWTLAHEFGGFSSAEAKAAILSLAFSAIGKKTTIERGSYVYGE